MGRLLHYMGSDWPTLNSAGILWYMAHAKALGFQTRTQNHLSWWDCLLHIDINLQSGRFSALYRLLLTITNLLTKRRPPVIDWASEWHGLTHTLTHSHSQSQWVTLTVTVSESLDSGVIEPLTELLTLPLWQSLTDCEWVSDWFIDWHTYTVTDTCAVGVEWHWQWHWVWHWQSSHTPRDKMMTLLLLDYD